MPSFNPNNAFKESEDVHSNCGECRICSSQADTTTTKRGAQKIKQEHYKKSHRVNQADIELTQKPITVWGGIASLIAKFLITNS